ncbi:ATP-binding protein [Leeuwenhoekiella sp. W20_SRS_FM14]|uniref:ATP-binding protein n=1 Tax=Leeuwenhoekiella sp. W20_SRS_FM14 TaxID=3240270 RepID=UPI003F9A0DBB
MNKAILFFFCGLLLSCGKDNKHNFKQQTIQDSALFYFDEAQDKTRSLVDRKISIEKALQLYNTKTKDTNYTKILYKKNWLNYSLGEFDSLLKYDDTLIKYALKIDDKSTLGMQEYLMGYYFEVVANQLDSAFVRYNKSKTNYLALQDSSWVGKNLVNMAGIQQTQSDFFGSKETITEALQFFENNDNTGAIASSYSVLGTNHRKLFNYNDAILYLKKAIKITDSDSDRNIYKNNLAATYLDNKEYKKAIEILKSVSKDSTVINNEKEYARVLDNLAYAQWLAGALHVETPLIQPLNIRKSINDLRGQQSSYTHLGEFYSSINEQKARAYFDTVIQISKVINTPKAEQDVLKKMLQFSDKNLQLRDRYIVLQDSLYQQELKVKTQFAKYKYDDKSKQESIVRLEKENALKELQTEQEQFANLVGKAIVICLLIVLVVIYIIFKQRTKRLKTQNRADRLEAAYTTETELSSRLHDDFGAGLNHVMLLLQTNSDKEIVLDELDGLYKQSRDFSREINEVETGEQYKQSLVALLQIQKPENTNLFITGVQNISWEHVDQWSKVALYKVLRELMINMRKHSEAKLVTVKFSEESNSLKINYEDNGVGASKEALILKNGLRNTEKRIKAIGGTISFDTETGKGFRALIYLPK